MKGVFPHLKGVFPQMSALWAPYERSRCYHTKNGKMLALWAHLTTFFPHLKGVFPHLKGCAIVPTCPLCQTFIGRWFSNFHQFFGYFWKRSSIFCPVDCIETPGNCELGRYIFWSFAKIATGFEIWSHLCRSPTLGLRHGLGHGHGYMMLMKF